MKKVKGLFIVFILLSVSLLRAQYFPASSWQEKSPQEFNVNKEKLDQAVQFALDHEYVGSRDLRLAIIKGFEREPYHKLLGPTKKRGGPAGMIIKNGYVIAKWGDTKRVDMTFSVTKSYLSTVAGLAVDAELIDDPNTPVNQYIWDGTFEGVHNSKITWHHLLTQSSDWSGNLFGGYDWADRPPKDGGIDGWRNRKLNEPGTYFKYNDVRVNVLAYSLLQTWRKPLPSVLKERVMDRIGASTTWRWYGYDNAWVNVDGTKMQSVSGGGHSGGGMFINTEDQARFGLLMARNGKWNEEQIISSKWIQMAIEPSEANQSYGYMWWLNKGDRNYDSLPEHGFYAAGFGGNYIWIDQKNDLLIVTRWLNPSDMEAMMKLVYDAVGK
jgi:CubicO group peptidase (beta-lactamase class C family)